MAMKRSSIGLRTRLLSLVLLAIVPAFGLIGYSTLQQREVAALNAKRDALNLVRLAAKEQSRLVTSTRQLLISLAQLPEMRGPDTAAACSRILGEVQRAYSYYTNIGVATLDGRLFCNSRPIGKPINIGDRTYFHRAVQSRDFSIGDYQIGRVTGINAINFGYPVLDERRRLRAVVYAALDLNWVEQLVRSIELPAGSTLMVIDSGGTVLARYPDSEKWIGKTLASEPIVATILGSRGEGTVESAGMGEKERIFAYAPLLEGASTNVYVSVGILKSVAFAAADADFKLNIALLCGVAALALLAAWLASDVFVLQRVNALNDAAQRLARGDLSARSGLPHGSEELGRLARSFDDMALTLQRVNRALKTLSAGNRALVRATSEQALLTEMCRVVVDVGGYPFAWIGYAQDDEYKSIHPVAQFGFEGGIPALSEWIAGITWADAALGHGAFGTAIRTAKPYVARNFLANPDLAPWREGAERYGYGSCVAFPLRVQDRVIGALGIYSVEPDGFDDEELQLLAEAADDLAFGISVVRTRAEHEQANATITRMAYYDSLTGLPNHVHFDEHLRRTMTDAGARAQQLALFVIGLNRFREINDALGFHQGDLLLKSVSVRLRGVVAEGTLLARMRGDEFAVLLPVGSLDGVTRIAQQILSALKAPFVISNLDLDITASIGISLFPQHGTEPAHFLRHADVAMQQAKKSGKGFVYYAAEHDEDSTRRLSMAAELRRAIEADELVLFYQPKIDMRNGSVCGVEALVRWNHPSRGMVAPDEFIMLAEHTGLIKPLTEWVMLAALRQSSQWRKEGLALPIAVNLSARNLHDTELLRSIERSFAAWGAEANWLELEITEGAVMHDAEGALATLKRLSVMGITLFIDDFGTGYSSLSYLKKLPVNSIKIDKSFVSDMLANDDSTAIVRSTIGLAHDLNLTVVAEGVETLAIWGQLAAFGCDVAQGYYISKPLPAAQFREWYMRRPNVTAGQTNQALPGSP